MVKKEKEKKFETPQQEIAFLKKQVAGLKGNQSFMEKRCQDLNKCVSQLLEEKEGLEKAIKGLESQVIKLNKEISKRDNDNEYTQTLANKYKEELDYYKSLPWYKKIF